jgi:hypothetical protein
LTAICTEDEHSTHYILNSNGTILVPGAISALEIPISGGVYCVAVPQIHGTGLPTRQFRGS